MKCSTYAKRKDECSAQFIGIVRKYSEIPKLTPEIMHEFIEKIVVYVPDKSSGHRTQQIDICFRFNVMTTTVIADSVVYDKRERLRSSLIRSLSVYTIKLLHRPPLKGREFFVIID